MGTKRIRGESDLLLYLVSHPEEVDEWNLNPRAYSTIEKDLHTGTPDGEAEDENKEP